MCKQNTVKVCQIEAIPLFYSHLVGVPIRAFDRKGLVTQATSQLQPVHSVPRGDHYIWTQQLPNVVKVIVAV